MKSMKLAFIGECMIELQESGMGVLKQTFGGDTLNSAIYCARLARGYPIEVEYVTALGTDTFSDRMTAFWEKEGVGSNLVQRIDGQHPGLYYIELDDHGERIFHYWRGEAAAKKCFEYSGSAGVLSRLAGFNGIYLSGISLAIFTPDSRAKLIRRLQELKSSGVSIFFDCNYRTHLWSSVQAAEEVYEQVYPLADITFLTVEEGEELFGLSDTDRVHAHLKEKGTRESVIKDGSGICSIFCDDQILKVPACPVKQVVDTTAAGDSFSAVYLLSRSQKCGPEQAALLAHKTAAYVISYKGAIAPRDKMPISAEDIERLAT